MVLKKHNQTLANLIEKERKDAKSMQLEVKEMKSQWTLPKYKTLLTASSQTYTPIN